MANRSAMLTIRGVEPFIRELEQFRKRVQTRIVKAAMRTVLSAGAKDIRSRIPGKYKLARKAVGYSLKRSRAGQAPVGKVGIGVGFTAKKRASYVAKRKSSGRTTKGVGIQADNLHWFVLGTKPRVLKHGSVRGPKAGHPTGAMPFDEGVRHVVSGSKIALDKGWFLDLFGGRMRYLIGVEAAKMRAKAAATKAFLDDTPF